MILQKNRTAFTMVEFIFVIVVLGIVASIGSEIIAQVYESYIVQRAQYKAAIKTETAINQIANRLRYAIPGTVGARKAKDQVFVPATEISDPNMNVLQWVGYDGDGFEARGEKDPRPGWSGFGDINNPQTDKKQMITPGSNLNLSYQIIQNLSGGTRTLSDAHIFFPNSDGASIDIDNGDEKTITFDTDIPSGGVIYERYKLAWSSYALSVENGDLWLYYNFDPINQTAIVGAAKIKKQVLLRDVTNFRFKASEGAIRVKICKTEKIGAGANDTVQACKEKVVF